MMTPGTIATLASIDRRNYDSAAEFAKALKWVIEDNQLAHPPEDGILEQKGYDFWTSKFSFFDIGYTEDLEGNTVTCTVNRQGAINANGPSLSWIQNPAWRPFTQTLKKGHLKLFKLF